MPSPIKPTPFGNYLLLDLIASGGMAEVFRAATLGFAGFQRLVAIKRILAKCAADQHFINMLIDEARIAVQLNDPNIVQVLELGVVEGKYYIAMEYVAGRDLRHFMTRLIRERSTMPVPVAAYVVSGVCSALDRAHRKTGADGQPLHIVHRDVSPHNVLIGFDGSVKVTDFGIARAEHRVSETEVGTIKGKFSYMAPEQVQGETLDRRADIFCAGILLYELLTGRRLFAAANDLQNLQAVRSCRITPPRALNPKIPERLEAVVMRALAVTPAQRYPWASAMFDDLQPFLIEERTVFTAQKLRAYLESTESAAVLAERRHTEELMRAAEAFRAAVPSSAAAGPADDPTDKVNLRGLGAGTVILATGTGEAVPLSWLETPACGVPVPPTAITQDLTKPTATDSARTDAPVAMGEDATAPTAVEPAGGASAMVESDTTPGFSIRTDLALDPFTIPAERTVPDPALAAAAAVARDTLVVEPVDGFLAQEATVPTGASGRTARWNGWRWLVGGGVAVLVVGALLSRSEPAVDVSVTGSSELPAAPAVAVPVTDMPSAVEAPAAAAVTTAGNEDLVRDDLLATRKAIDAQLRSLGILVGDVPAVDQQRQRLIALVREDRLVEALEVAARIVAALDAVVVDEVFVAGKRARLERQAAGLADEVLRLQLDEVRNEVGQAMRAQDHRLANHHLNRGFRLMRGVK